MKKIIALLLTLCLVFALTACGGTNNDTQGDAQTDTTQNQTQGDTATDTQEPKLTTVTEGKLTVATSPDFAPYEFYTLDENGYYIEIEMLTYTRGSYGDCGKVMQSNLKEAGINMKLTLMESAAWNERVGRGDFDMAMLNGYQGPDPDAMSKRITTGGVANYSHWSNAEVDELLRQARILTKDEDRGACYRKIQEIQMAELPIVPVVEMTTYYICRSNISGIPYIDHTPDVHDNNYSKVVID